MQTRVRGITKPPAIVHPQRLSSTIRGTNTSINRVNVLLVCSADFFREVRVRGDQSGDVNNKLSLSTLIH